MIFNRLVVGGLLMGLSVIFQIICLIIFAAAGLAWVLNLFGRIALDPDQKKILNTAFGVSVIGGLAATVGPGFFEPDGPTAPNGPAATTTAPSSGPASGASGAVASPSTPPTAKPVTPTDTPTPPAPSTPTPTACRPAAHPEFLTEWATAALGTPPTFRCAIAAPYPVCIADLRETQFAEISREAALSCGAQLLAFRQTHISPAYAAKLTYQDNLDAAEAGLRNPRNVEEAARRNYIIAEITRMNGVLWKDFTALDQRSKTDMLACQTDANRCLTDQ